MNKIKNIDHSYNSNNISSRTSLLKKWKLMINNNNNKKIKKNLNQQYKLQIMNIMQ